MTASSSSKWGRWVGGVIAAVAALAPPGHARAEDHPRTSYVTDPSASSGGEVAPAKTSAVILITIDGVRWQEIFDGTDMTLARKENIPDEELQMAEAMLPNLYEHFVHNGVGLGAPGMGPDMLSAPPALSLPGYMELLSGRREPLCVSNKCPAVSSRTLLDQAFASPSFKFGDVAAITSWEIIKDAATSNPTSFPMSFGRGYGLTRKKVGVTPEAKRILDKSEKSRATPGIGDYRADRFTAPLALEYLKARKPKLLYIGLGDPDEHAHHGDYRAYQRSLREADAFLGEVFKTLGQMGEYGATTTVIVTTDHGRASDFIHHGHHSPESQRIWMFAAGGSIPRKGLVPTLTERHLADIAPTIRHLLGLPADTYKHAGNILTEILPAPAPAPQDKAR